ncbi:MULTISPECIES: hypothetical protein [unclassified Anabaena]|nr:hypothetical protein [Anabaena sp. UHCC 0399]MEA5565424.1 hypothetical protein [Anabaena sp. UHCC 0399]
MPFCIVFSFRNHAETAAIAKGLSFAYRLRRGAAHRNLSIDFE